MADSRHFEKSKTRHISAMVLPIGTKFGSVILWFTLIPQDLKFSIYLTPRWRSAVTS